MPRVRFATASFGTSSVARATLSFQLQSSEDQGLSGSFSVTSVVNDWRSHQQPNDGFVLKTLNILDNSLECLSRYHAITLVLARL